MAARTTKQTQKNGAERFNKRNARESGTKTETDGCILVFVKAPERSQVKTRLARSIGDELALEFYKGCVHETLTVLKATGFPVRICYHPSERKESVAAWLGNGHPLFPQEGSDLGEHMADAFARAFDAGFNRAVLVGTDIPQLNPPLLMEAFSCMDRHGAVIGPARDGGYYLIGFCAKTFNPDVFSGVSWGTDTVYRKTLQRLDKKELSVHVLPCLEDVDTLEALLNCAAQAPAGSFLSKWVAKRITNKENAYGNLLPPG